MVEKDIFYKYKSRFFLYKTFKLRKKWGQVKYARRHFYTKSKLCTQGHFYTNKHLHEGAFLHDELLCTKTLFHDSKENIFEINIKINKKNTKQG